METPRSEEYNDIYFCEEDGLAEGDHVFLKGNGLPGKWENRANFVIAETGFGTGLNFLASWLKWDETAKAGQHLTYISFEKYPLSKEKIREALSRWKTELGGRLEIMLDAYPALIAGWHNIEINPGITLLLIFDDVNRALPELNAQVDAWFLDGFAPAKNPEMWSETVFKAMAKNSHSDTTVASFTAAGLVKNGLRTVGFHIAKTRGFGRKRDMIYGHFLGDKKRAEPKKVTSVAVIGGGLAGTSIAAKLAGYGVKVDLYEDKSIASGASGNARGLFNPRFTAQRNGISEFYASAFALTLRRFSRMENIGYQPLGSLHLLTDPEKAKRLIGACENWGWHENHMRIVDAGEASRIAGIPLSSGALYLPQAGFVDPAKLCAELSKNVKVISDQLVHYDSYNAVIIAAGLGSIAFNQLNDIPLHTVRGQISYAPETDLTKQLKANICYGGYCSAAMGGFHVIGSTFQPWLNDTDVKAEDHDAILSNLNKYVPELATEMKITGGRAALRTTSKDRFPVVGKVNDNLYVSTAHGSHGIISSLLSAEIIAAEITGRVQPVPDAIIAELSPERFAMRAAKRA